MFNNSLWDWELGLQREGNMYYNGIACCVDTSGRVSVRMPLCSPGFQSHKELLNMSVAHP